MPRMMLAAFAVAALASAPASAEETTLNFKLITKALEYTAIPASATDGHMLAVASMYGVAVFEDGRIAQKTYSLAAEDTPDGSSWYGFSTYTFEDGSTLTARYDGGSTGAPDGSTGGAYSEVAGTGAFEGMSGKGDFTYADNPWDGSAYWTGSFTLTKN